MLPGGAPIPTGRKTSCPETMSHVQFGVAVGIDVGLPFVVIVVARIVVDVLEAAIVVSIRVKEVDFAVIVLSAVDVNVELFSVMVTASLVRDKNVDVLSNGKVATVVCVIMLLTVVVGTEMVCVVVDSGTSVALVNGANVVSGWSVEAVTEGRLVGNGGTAGFPPVSKVL